MARVCIDAGHSGKRNRSPAVPEYYESEAMWKLHLLLKAELEKYGITVVTTRKEQDKDVSLYNRGACSKASDLFLSLHSNAVGGVNENTDHVSVYHLMDDDGTECDDVSKAFAAKIAPVIAETMGVQKGYKLLTRKSDKDKNHDGEMNDNYYGVLHGARTVGTPGLILEHSFHTCTRSTKWLLEESNLQKLAVAEAKCIAEFFSVEIKENKGDFTVEMRNLKKGCEGADVQALQILLNGKGYNCGSADGIFGTKTDKAVRAYQADFDGALTVDGIAGKNTMSRLLGL